MAYNWKTGKYEWEYAPPNEWHNEWRDDSVVISCAQTSILEWDEQGYES